jgi:hypothetical protein
MESMTRRSTTFGAVIFAALAGLSGCKQKVLCPGLDVCGGSVVGDWVLDGNNPNSQSCMEDLYTPPADPRLQKGADVPAARTPIPEPALWDWCHRLVTGPGEMIIVTGGTPRFDNESAQVGAAMLHYDGSGTEGGFTLTTVLTGRFTMNFPPICMHSFGAADNAMGDVCTQLATFLSGQNLTRYKNISCGKDDPTDAFSGCDCTFDLNDVQASAGRYVSQSGGVLLHLPGNNFPESVSVCASADRLQLTGADGEYLFDRLGLRTLDMVRVTSNCTNMAQDIGELGVDCGGLCGTPCM